MDKLTYYIDKIRGVINGNVSLRDVQKQIDVFKSSCLRNIRDEDKDIEEFLLLCIECGHYTIMEFATEMIKQRKSIYLKEHPKVIYKIFQFILKYGKLPKSHREFYSDDPFEYFMSAMCSMLNVNKLVKDYAEQLYNLTLCAFTIRNNRLLRTISRTNTWLPWNLNSDWGIQIIQRIYEIVQYSPTLVQYELKNCAEKTLSSIYDNCRQNKRLATLYASYTGELVIFCSQQEYNFNGKKTLAYELLTSTLTKYLSEHGSKIEVVQPVLQACKELTKCECSRLQEYSNDVIEKIPGNLLVELDESLVLEMIEGYINGDDKRFINRMEQVYSKAPHIFHTSLLDDIAQRMEQEVRTFDVSTALYLFATVIKQQPQKITEKTLQYIMNELDHEDQACGVLMTIMPLSEKRPDMLIPYEDKIMETMSKHKLMANLTCTMLVHMARNSEEKTEKYLQVICHSTQEHDSQYNVSLFNHMHQMGKPFPKQLVVYEKFFKGYITHPTLGQHAEQVLNTMHGISFAAITQDIQETQQDVEELDKRVTHTEDNVGNLSREVDENNTPKPNINQTRNYNEFTERMPKNKSHHGSSRETEIKAKSLLVKVHTRQEEYMDAKFVAMKQQIMDEMTIIIDDKIATAVSHSLTAHENALKRIEGLEYKSDFLQSKVDSMCGRNHSNRP